MHLTSETSDALAQNGPEGEAREDSLIESPPTAPYGESHGTAHASPWWTAPAGKPINIPDFGQVLFGALVAALVALLVPQPQPIPLRIRARR